MRDDYLLIVLIATLGIAIVVALVRQFRIERQFKPLAFAKRLLFVWMVLIVAVAVLFLIWGIATFAQILNAR